MEWLKISEVVNKNVITRNELIAKLRENGVEIADDAKIAVGIADNEICYAADAEGEIVFFEDVIFTPSNWEELKEEIVKIW